MNRAVNQGGLEEELTMWRESVATFLDQAVSPERMAKWESDKMVSRDFWLEAGSAGLLGTSLPAEWGGAGGDFRHEAVIIDELGKRGLECWGYVVHSIITLPYLLTYATEVQKRRWIPGLISGESILAIAMTEPGAGSDLQGIKTKAELDGDEWVISGQKTFISNGQSADLILVACRTGGEGAKGISLIVVEAKREGFLRGRNLDKIGRDAQDTSELYFDEVRVPRENLLGEEPGKGFGQLMTMLPQERLAIAGMGLAILERALAETVAYTKERRAFGKTLFDLQNTQFTLAEIKTQAVIARNFYENCIGKLVAGSLDPTTASMAKLWITETEVAAVSRCLQLFGGYGYMNEYPIARMYRDARIDTIHGGASEIMKLMIARTL